MMDDLRIVKIFRLSYDDGEFRELLDSISELVDVKCVCFKNESLHLSLNLIDWWAWKFFSCFYILILCWSEKSSSLTYFLFSVLQLKCFPRNFVIYFIKQKEKKGWFFFRNWVKKMLRRAELIRKLFFIISRRKNRAKILLEGKFFQKQLKKKTPKNSFPWKIFLLFEENLWLIGFLKKNLMH